LLQNYMSNVSGTEMLTEKDAICDNYLKHFYNILFLQCTAFTKLRSISVLYHLYAH